MRNLLVAIGLILAGLSFPGMFYLSDKRALPRIPEWTWDATRSFTHNAKDAAVEMVRFDAQYWTKAFAFVIVLLIILNLWQFIRRK